MKQFVPTFRGQDWESGAGALHLYVRPEEADTEFHDLVAACRFAFRVSLSHLWWPLSGLRDSAVRRTPVLSH